MPETDAELGPTATGESVGAPDPVAVPRTTTIAPTRDLVVIAGAVALLIAFAPIFMSAPYSPRFAILVGFLPVGVVALVALCLRRDRAAMAATAFAVVGVISSLLSDHIRISLIGQMGKEASALLLAAFLGWWAIGRHLTDRGRAVLPYALLAGMGINAFVAVLQVVVDNNSGSEFGVTTDGRAVGLTANPVQLGALMAAGAAISATLAMTAPARRWIWWAVAVGVFAGAANLSGTRIAIISMALVLVGLAVAYRTWRVMAMAGAAVGGVLLSTLLFINSGDRAASARLGDSGYGRSTAWTMGLKSFLERPLLGFGPGGFRGATQARYTADFVRTAAMDERQNAWFDAHNVAIEYLVATGIVGLALLAIFAWFALRRARGPLLAAFVAIAITWMVQPLSVSTAPVAMLALGAAVPVAATITGVEERRHHRSVGIAFTIAGVVGLVLACGYAFVDLRLDAAVRSDDAARIESAARWFPRDAVVADVVAQGWANAFFYHGADKSQLVAWAGEPAEREPDRPYWWSKRAGTQIAFGDYEGARVSLDRAIALQPWSPTAWPLMIELGKQTDDAELQALATEKVCELQLNACPHTDG